MARRMSFSKTVEQVRAGTKTVTRRDGWLHAEPGMRITAIEKGMGLPKGARQVVIRDDLEVVSVRRERLGDITREDVAREGFPGRDPAFFVAKYGKPADHVVTRIEFRYLTSEMRRG